MADLIQIRRDTRSNWSVNPTLAIGEIGIITDNNTPGNTGSVSLKIGNGQATWDQLPEQAFVKPDDIRNLSASIAAVQTGSAGDIQEVSASINTRINNVSSSLSTSIANVSTSLGNVDAKFTAATSSLSASIADVNTRLTNVSGSISTSMSSMSSSINTRINEVSESITVAIEETIPVISQSISASAAELNDRIDDVEQDISDNYARKDGYYTTLTAGAAENLVGQTVDSEAYLIRPTGGADNEVANGAASVIGMEGHTEKFNQLFNGDNRTGIIAGVQFTCNGGHLIGQGTPSIVTTASIFVPNPVISGHKYYIGFRGTVSGNCAIRFYLGERYTEDLTKSVIGTCTRDADFGYAVRFNNTNSVSINVHLRYHDLTAIFGAGNEPSTVAEFEAWLAKNVGLKSYYGYNAGALLSAQTLGVKTYGQNLLNPTTRQARLIPYDWEDNSNVYTIKNVPSGATATFTPDATGVAETVDISGGSLDITSYGRGVLELSAATTETYVCMKWDEGKDDDVVPFEEHTQTFDVRKVYGKVNGAGEYVQCFPNGLRGAGTAKDTLNANEAVSRIGDVDLGILNWTYSYGAFNASRSGLTGRNNIICSKYPTSQTASVPDGGYIANKEEIGKTTIWIKDSSYATAADLKASLNGIPLYYELAEPITYTDLVYRDGGIDTPITDVLFNIDVDNWSIEEQLLTPYDENGCPTAVPAKISTNYGMDAVEEIDTIKHTYVSAYNEQEFSDAQKAQARRNIGAVEENGSYPNMSVGIAKNLAGENAVEAEYTYRQSNGTIGTDTGIANVTDVKGETLKWNQLVSTARTEQSNSDADTRAEDYFYITATGQSSQLLAINTTAAVGRQHLIFNSTITASTAKIIISGQSANTELVEIKNLVSEHKYYLAISITANDITTVGGYKWKDTIVIDLTLMFGAGNEPSTVAEFEALYPLDYYDYNAGALVNNTASAIETTGFNQWDEEWEDGAYNPNTGVKVNNGNTIRTKNKIPCFPNTYYYFCKKNPLTANVFYVIYYDKSGNFVGNNLNGNYNIAKLTPVNAYYMTFFLGSSAYPVRTYNNDICINLSDPAKNGTYEPYEKHTFYFDKVLQGEGSLATIKGKLNGEGESVVVFPDGLKRVGNVFDEIKGNVAIKRLGVVDLGDLSWVYTSGEHSRFEAAVSGIKTVVDSIVPNMVSAKYTTMKLTSVYNHSEDKIIGVHTLGKIWIYDSAYTDTATFKAAMNGVILYYELVEPETYILDQTVTGGYQVNANGTERRLPEDTASSVNAPVNYSVIYPINAVGTLIKLPVNYISERSLTNFTAELASKLGTFLSASINISASYDSTDQEYDYSITITPNA